MADRIKIVSRDSGLPPQYRQPAKAPKAGAKAYEQQVAPGWIVLQADGHPELTVLCELLNAPDLEEGYSGWSQVPRQRAEALSRWDGFDALAAPFELYMDGLETGRSINDVYDTLDALAGRGRKAANTLGAAVEPPKLLVDTAGVFRHDASVFPDARWIIAGNPEWDTEEAIVDEATGDRLRASCTIHLRKYVEPQRLRNAALEAAARAQAKVKKSKSYTVVAGDTLVSIARRKLHDPGRWEEIADLNDIRDPSSVRPGARLRLP